MKRVPGVVSTQAGYTGGEEANPTHEQVGSGATGHAESVRVVFDRTAISYEELAKLFFEIHDPTHVDRQGPDVGRQYRTEIFYLSPSQRKTAEKLVATLKKRGFRVATRITPADEFYPAEEYHQNRIEKSGRMLCDSYVRRF